MRTRDCWGCVHHESKQQQQQQQQQQPCYLVVAVGVANGSKKGEKGECTCSLTHNAALFKEVLGDLCTENCGLKGKWGGEGMVCGQKQCKQSLVSSKRGRIGEGTAGNGKTRNCSGKALSQGTHTQDHVAMPRVHSTHRAHLRQRQAPCICQSGSCCRS